ncbi:diacylglycerol kinase (ATP) [Natronobacillus azotifigens]|uniref:Diacylglycerol kinase n=1 Tax=Natronobacillus azotifigens TaxID=472978 RepID=A0A9J6RB46_9BACI|nr:diacylglycerol kinase [Natronobacillus azotifigens]MCZ0702896.1 diacylglycerol kinase [Natronobacillus azotifigens]
MKRARIIYNPTSGREGFKKDIPEVLQKFEQAGYETSVHATTCAGDATEAAKCAVARGFDTVVAVGGDGTINEVINGIAEAAHRPKLGIIPAGTTNDFARALGLPKNINKAVEVILTDKTKALDVGRVNGHYFVNIAGGGKLTEVSYEVPSKLKTVLGQLAYFIKGIELLPMLHPIHTKIEYDGNLFEEEIMLFLVANTNSVGGFEKLAPEAKMDDGLFDLLVLKKTNMAEFVRIISALTRGNHFDDPKVFHARAREIKIHTDEKMQLNIDGEYGGVLPGEFINFKQHIEYFVPTPEQSQMEDEKLSEKIEALD